MPLLLDVSSYHRPYLACWVCCVAIGPSLLRYCLPIESCGYVALFVEEGREGRDSARVAMYRSHLLLYCKFFTPRNLKETLANFSRNPRLSLFGTIVTLGGVKNSFDLIPMRETRS